MEEYIKYPLNINKKDIDWSLAYMKNGGAQLIEVMEKEFPLSKIKENKEEYKISDRQINKIKCWLKNNTVVGKVQQELGMSGSFGAKNFFYDGKGVLGKLFNRIDLTPIYKSDKFISKWSFIEYEIVRTEIGTIVISKLKNWYCNSSFNDPKNHKNLIQTFYYLELNGEAIPLDKKSETAKKLKNAYEVSKSLTI